jgi:hypothetical protein
MSNIFTKHPHKMNESYFQHLYCAAIFGFSMILGGIFCLIHAVFPFLFEKTGSNFLFKMTHNYVERSPHNECRIEKLSQLLEKKFQRCKK